MAACLRNVNLVGFETLVRTIFLVRTTLPVPAKEILKTKNYLNRGIELWFILIKHRGLLIRGGEIPKPSYALVVYFVDKRLGCQSFFTSGSFYALHEVLLNKPAC